MNRRCNRMVNKSLSLVLLVAAITLTGCTALEGGGDTGTSPEVSVTPSDGLTIAFSSATPEYFADQGSATFTANVENTGEGEATLNSMELFGASWAAGESVDLGDGIPLASVEQANNLPGETYSATFTPGLGDISLGRGQSDDYTVGLRTTYEYSSETRSELTVMETDLYRSEGRAQRQVMSNTIRGAPVRIRFTGNTPFPERGDTISVPIRVSNVGDGSIQNDQITLTVEAEGIGTAGDCDERDVTLYQGDREFTCSVPVGSLAGPQKDVTVIATASYTYVEDDTTRVTVIGTE